MRQSLKNTSAALRHLGARGPTLLIDEARARANIARMVEKAQRAGAVLRPHFKTHQNARVGEWFRQAGVDRITVSSAVMAERFADVGWLDITLAFLLNPHELPRLGRLARHLDGRGGGLGLTVDSVAAAEALASEPDLPVAVWLKIDTGYGRTGLRWDRAEAVAEVLAALPGSAAGLLTHAGHSYRARSAPELEAIWAETSWRLAGVREVLDRPDLLLSVGDTPTCSEVEDLSGVDELRPGNFVYYDLMQLQIGSCGETDLAAAVACPVVGVYPERRQAVIHGGAVHLSKESLVEEGRTVWGRLGTVGADGKLGTVVPGTAVVSVSQEHGIVELDDGLTAGGFPLEVGDVVLVWPVHSCLAAGLVGEEGARMVGFP